MQICWKSKKLKDLSDYFEIESLDNNLLYKITIKRPMNESI